MNHHAVFSLMGGILAMLMFIPLFLRTRREGGVGQSFASWLLWGLLDLILIFSLLEQQGNFWIIAGFAIGDFSLALLLAAQRRFNWTRFETGILVLVTVCVIGWQTGGAKAGTIFSIAAVCVAGIPGFLALKRNPDRPTGWIWLGFSFANFLSVLGGTSMALEQRLTPAIFALASLLMVWAGFQRPLRPHQTSTGPLGTGMC
jgi:hypothetical protein